MSHGFTTKASAEEKGVRATVPFDFAVGSRILPQGTYNIGPDGGFVAFKGTEKKASLFTIAPRGESSKDGKSVLVFDNVEGQYFLRKIVTTSTQSSVEFPLSKLERKTRESVSTRNIYAEASSR
jgi:hypothetical protein